MKFHEKKPWLTAENLQILEVRSKSKKIWKQKANTSIYKTNENARWRQNEESKHDKMKKPKNMAKWRNKWRQKTKPRSGIINSEDEALNLIISYITTYNSRWWKNNHLSKIEDNPVIIKKRMRILILWKYEEEDQIWYIMAWSHKEFRCSLSQTCISLFLTLS